MRTKVDKKNIGGRKRIVLLSRVGDYLIERAMAPAVEIPQSFLNDTSSAEIAVPSSKSIPNRALVLTALGQGSCKLRGLLYSDDTQVMLEALRLFAGIQYQWEDNDLTLVIEGCGNPSKSVVPSVLLYLGNAGTASILIISPI
jgi:pentafunctional AROM polypeptide